MSKEISRRQFLRASGAFATAGLIAACAPVTSTTESDTGNAPAPAGERVVVNHWHNWAEPVDQRLLAFAERFNEMHPDIEVVPLFVGNMAETYQKVIAALAANEPPQIANGFPYTTIDYVDSGAVVPAEDFLITDGELSKDDFWPVTPAELTYQGKIWAVPVTNVPRMLFYNKSHFAEAGIDAAPATWSDLLTAASACTQINNGVVERWGMTVTTNELEFLNYAYQNGARYLNDDATQVEINSEAGVETLQFLADLVLEHQVAPPDLSSGEDPFKANLLSINYSTPTAIQRYRDAGLDFGVGRVPYNTEPAAVVQGNVWYVYKNVSPESLAATQEYIRWFLSPDIHGEWIPQIGHAPVLRGAVESASIQQYLEEYPEYQIALDELEISTSIPPRKNAAELTSSLRTHVETALRGAQSPEEALATFAAEGNELLNG